jgi:hypothetical protein
MELHSVLLCCDLIEDLRCVTLGAGVEYCSGIWELFPFVAERC